MAWKVPPGWWVGGVGWGEMRRRASKSALGRRCRSSARRAGWGGGTALVGLHKHWVLRALTVANTSQLVHTGAADDTACTVVVGTIAVVFLGVKVVQPAGRT